MKCKSDVLRNRVIAKTNSYVLYLYYMILAANATKNSQFRTINDLAIIYYSSAYESTSTFVKLQYKFDSLIYFIVYREKYLV